MKKLLIATRNKGKFKEFLGILKNLPFEFLFLDDVSQKIPLAFEIKETGKTFKENAILKAKAYAKKSGLLTLADDSGLCVDFLKGKPGVASHRFGQGSDKDRNEKLLKLMEKVPKDQRKAKFVSAICLYNPLNGKTIISRGICSGEIAFKPKGDNGFGYDPVFIVKGLNKHFAELTVTEKNQVSHRAKALRKMLKHLYCLSTSEVKKAKFKTSYCK
jgi:XTP/dITP diphosphohydrolase